MKKIHWKELTNPNYLGAYSLQPHEERTIKITKIVKEMVKGAGGVEAECTVAHIDNNKPMILNKTNCKIIEKLFKTPYIDDWIGKNIIIYSARIKAFGDIVYALRIKEELATTAELPELNPDNKNWLNVVNWLKTNKDVNKIRIKYKLSVKNELLIIKAAKI